MSKDEGKATKCNNCDMIIQDERTIRCPRCNSLVHKLDCRNCTLCLFGKNGSGILSKESK
ncbi:MAG: hypothetical protein KGZ75_14205 [Syntrophomonadaceae bacterium]|nr:hypothetical protein [Syntrophomonadaceae bacterium]